MKTIVHNSKQSGGRGRFFLATLIAVVFSLQSNAQLFCGAGFNHFTQGNYVTFVDSSYSAANDSISQWAWTFGDGTSGSGPYVTHQYNSIGTFTVCLTITTYGGCVNTSCQTIVISSIPCSLQAYIFPDSLGTGLYVGYSGNSGPVTINWSTGATTNYISTPNPGMYCVTVTDSSGCVVTDCDSGGVTSCSPYFIFTVQAGVVSFQNYSSGLFQTVSWDFGDSTTSIALNPVHTYASPGTYQVCLTIYNNGVACNTYCSSVTIQSPPNSTLCGTIFVDVNGNGVFDSTDTYLSNQVVLIYGNGIQTTVTTDSNGYYSINVMAGTYYISYCTNFLGAIVTLPIDSSLYCGVYYAVTIGPNQVACGYNFAIQYTSVVITGKLYVDANNNGAFDAGESGIPYQLVNVGAFNAYTNSFGLYTINVPAGTYTISYSPQSPYAIYSLTTPGSISLNAGTVGSTYSGNDFGLYIPPGTTDLSIQLLAHTTVTPGFPAWYDIYVCNNGIVPVGANVTMVYDPALIFNYASPAQAVINTSTQTITWNLPTIFPGFCSSIWVSFHADSTVGLGVPTFEFVSVTPSSGTDIDLSNNTDTVHQVSTGSWDPNNKLSIKTNNNDPNKQLISSVNPDQEITYTVNFQNTGSAQAVNVVVIDQLSTDLDANSFQWTGSSHPCNVTRTGNQVVYTFSNILLPDSGSNEVASHGFISFKANAINNLTAGTVISDNASIYFDFNQAVVTGNTHIVLFDPLGMGEIGSGPQIISVYPNPVKESAIIDYTLSSPADVSIEIMDISGKICQALMHQNEQAGKHSITWNTDLQAGVYFVKLQVNGVASLTKVTVIK